MCVCERGGGGRDRARERESERARKRNARHASNCHITHTIRSRHSPFLRYFISHLRPCSLRLLPEDASQYWHSFGPDEMTGSFDHEVFVGVRILCSPPTQPLLLRPHPPAPLHHRHTPNHGHLHACTNTTYPQCRPLPFSTSNRHPFDGSKRQATSRRLAGRAAA